MTPDTNTTADTRDEKRQHYPAIMLLVVLDRLSYLFHPQLLAHRFQTR